MSADNPKSKPIRQLGNHIKTREDVDDTQTEFSIHSIASFIECASVMAKLFRENKNFDVKLEKIEVSDE